MLNQLYRKSWLLRSLTRTPDHGDALVSDLFFWRCTNDWCSTFELFDIASLFPGHISHKHNQANFVFFDRQGVQRSIASVEMLPNQRQSIDISELLGTCDGEYGTFACFHPASPAVVISEGSFLAERGYAGYSFKTAALSSYVHGNLDAIALLPNQNLQLLGRSGWRLRQYNLQHFLKGPALYEFALVNPTLRQQQITLKTRQYGQDSKPDDHKLIEHSRATILPRGVHLFVLDVQPEQAMSVTFVSRLVMARPLVFCRQKNTVNVFHG
jgi:hypothetical protein